MEVNRNISKIEHFLRDSGSQPMHIAHKRNRIVIFDRSQLTPPCPLLAVCTRRLIHLTSMTRPAATSSTALLTTASAEDTRTEG